MKAIITDLDGTLLRTDKTISPYTREVIGRCRERGISIIAATARPFRSLGKYLEQIAFDAVVTWNGARIFIGGEAIENTIDTPSANTVLKKLVAFSGSTVSVETNKGFFANKPIPLPDWTPIVLKSFAELPKDARVYKILASGGENLRDGVGGILPSGAYYTIAGEDLIQIMSTSATKKNAAAFVLEKLGVPREEATFFGDDNDDIEAIDWCGIGCAVRNAKTVVKNAADIVVGSNDDDGVAKYIEAVLEQSQQMTPKTTK